MDTLLNEDSSPAALRRALDEFATTCAAVGGITPDRSFDGWRLDTMLDQGVAINPQAAAFCIKDYRRSVMFLRGVYCAIQQLKQRFTDQPIRVLYAGCGPFALLLLPLLEKLTPGKFDIHLLDIHQSSLDSVAQLVDYFSLEQHQIQYIQADACHYQHEEPLHLVIAETMQKSLEQEPQFAVTENLASQILPDGIFVPEKIEVELCLAQLEQELICIKDASLTERKSQIARFRRHSLVNLFELAPGLAAEQLQGATCSAESSQREIALGTVKIPAINNLASFDAALFTRIRVFSSYRLDDYDSEISLPAKCHEMLPLQAGACYEASYQLGAYPRFNFRKTSL
jgi:hypothetical protein